MSRNKIINIRSNQNLVSFFLLIFYSLCAFELN